MQLLISNTRVDIYCSLPGDASIRQRKWLQLHYQNLQTAIFPQNKQGSGGQIFIHKPGFRGEV